MNETTKGIVEIGIEELRNRIRSTALLRMPDGRQYRATASAWFNAYDDNVAERGTDLAVGRALSALNQEIRRRSVSGAVLHAAA